MGRLWLGVTLFFTACGPTLEEANQKFYSEVDTAKANCNASGKVYDGLQKKCTGYRLAEFNCSKSGIKGEYAQVSGMDSQYKKLDELIEQGFAFDQCGTDGEEVMIVLTRRGTEDGRAYIDYSILTWTID